MNDKTLLLWSIVAVFILAIGVCSALFTANELNRLWDDHSDSVVYVNKVSPKIKVTFAETANLTLIELYGKNGSRYFLVNLTEPVANANQTQFMVEPKEDLGERNYILVINASDTGGNALQNLKVVPFVIDVTPPDLEMTNPSDGAVFDDSDFKYYMVFDEPVNVTYSEFSSNINTYKVTDDTKPTTGSGYSKNFVIDPHPQLDDNVYNVTFTARDRAGNNRTFKRSVVLNSNPLKIWIKSPQFGVGNASKYNITFMTSRDANCKYAYRDVGGFDDATLQFFDEPVGTYKTEHIHVDYDDGDPIGEDMPAGSRYYVYCIDSLSQQEVEKEFRFFYDLTAPRITSLLVNPNPIVSVDRNATFSVVADDMVFCRYSNTTDVFDEMEYGFGREDVTNVSGYNTGHYTVLNYPQAEIDQLLRFLYKVQCINLAGMMSEVKDYAVTVNLSSVLTITVNSPRRYAPGSLKFDVSTSGRADCEYTLDNGSAQAMTNSLNELEHTTNYMSLEEGEHSVMFECVGRGEPSSKSVDFLVDSVAPSVNEIDDFPQCSTDQYRVSWNATYNVALIDYYNVTLFLVNETYDYYPVETEKINQDEDDCDDGVCEVLHTFKHLDLEEGIKYGVKVTPYSKTGKDGSDQETVGRVIDLEIDECQETNPPTVVVNQTFMDGLTIVRIDCDDDTGCNDSKQRYGLGSDVEDCQPTRLYDGNFSVTENQTLCYQFYDVLDNVRSDSVDLYVYDLPGNYCETNSDCPNGMICGTDNVCKGETCSDGIRNQDETDIDCGGVCEGCKGGPSCEAGDGCAVGCDPIDIDCGGRDATCGGGDTCKADCNPVDPDCGGATCDVGDACINGCIPRDPDCTGGTCQAGDICMLGCDPVDPDCGGGATCNSGDGCYGGNCPEPDPDCDGATCKSDDVCLIGCATYDPDCLGEKCTSNTDCEGDCYNGFCITPLCNDGIKNQDETDVDCGGSCGTCPGAPTCSSGDGCVVGCEKVDYDCGKTSISTCGYGDGCVIDCPIPDPDCGRASCNSGDACAAGCEPVDPDCGGATCGGGDKCMIGCEPVDPDCGGGLSCDAGDGCSGGSCQVPDPDCDGATCGGGNVCLDSCYTLDPDCIGGQCNDDTDCPSGSSCVDYFCSLPSCYDKKRNQDETDADCGGSTCPACKLGEACLKDSDCESGSCESRTCVQDRGQDSDNDGMPDWWESDNGLNPNDGTDAGIDSDGDGLLNLEEYNMKVPFADSTNPQNPDTDGDGYSDYDEYNHNTSPLDPLDYPSGSVMKLILLIIGIILILAGLSYGGFSYYQYSQGGLDLSSLQGGSSAPSRMPQQPGMPQQRVMPQRPQLSPEQQRKLQMQRQRYEQRRQQLESERKKVFEKFTGDSKGQPKVVPKPAVPKSEKVVFEEDWVPVDKLRNALEKHGQSLEQGDIDKNLSKIINLASNRGTLESLSTVPKGEMDEVASHVHPEAAKKLADATSGKGEDVVELMSSIIEDTTLLSGKVSKKSVEHISKVAKADEDVFRKLSEVTNEKLDAAIDSFVANAKVNAHGDLVKLFADISVNNKKSVVIDVFSQVLTSLVKVGKVKKEDIYEVMDELEKEGVLTSKDTGRVVERLSRL